MSGYDSFINGNGGTSSAGAGSSEGITCPKCNSGDVRVELKKENQGHDTVGVRHSTMRRGAKKHGLGWWLCIGWWYWLFFGWWVGPLKAILLGRSGKVVGTANTVHGSHTKNQIKYRSVCMCRNCGHVWTASEMKAR